MTKPVDLRPDINFLFEMGAMRLMPRLWTRFFSPHMANQTEHHFRVFWIAMVIAANENNIDTGKLAKMCLVHDIAESRSGDVDYLSRMYSERNGLLGIQDMLTGTSIEKEFITLWQEYEERKTIEAKIVKDADNLDCDWELAEQAAMGNTLQKNFTEMRQAVSENKLFTDTAKKLFKQLQDANPHDWHSKGRNRRTEGDWKK